MDDSNSYDILRIDLNTLRSMGRDISRSCQRTNFKYVLLKHPFSLKINSEEFEVLKKAFKKIKNNTEIDVLVKYDELFNKIAQQVADEDLKEALIGLCSLKAHNIEQIKELNAYCKAHQTLTLIYKSPSASAEEEMVVAAEKLTYKNDKIYLYGFDVNKKQSVALLVKRILSILSNKDSDENSNTIPVSVKFILKEFTVAGLEDNEKIVEKNDEGYLIEASYHNEFIAVQRILSFGSSCVVISPDEFKSKIIETLKKLKEIYDEKSIS